MYMVSGEDGHIHLADLTLSVAAIEKKPKSRQMDNWILTPNQPWRLLYQSERRRRLIRTSGKGLLGKKVKFRQLKVETLYNVLCPVGVALQ